MWRMSTIRSWNATSACCAWAWTPTKTRARKREKTCNPKGKKGGLASLNLTSSFSTYKIKNYLCLGTTRVRTQLKTIYDYVHTHTIAVDFRSVENCYRSVASFVRFCSRMLLLARTKASGIGRVIRS